MNGCVYLCSSENAGRPMKRPILSDICCVGLPISFPIYSGVLQVGIPIIYVVRGIFYNDTTPFVCFLDGEVFVPSLESSDSGVPVWRGLSEWVAWGEMRVHFW